MKPIAWQTISESTEYTEELAERLGRNLKGGETIELVSDLGGGKTTFVRGLVRGLGGRDKVASPTFTISKMYQAGELEVHHFDFYRLHEAGIIADELAEVTGDPKTIVIVEWADVVQHVLPSERLTILIMQTPSGSRQLTFTYPEPLSYLLEAVKA
jgi:tRNA threonylcarbamoyladenosine biosynthesis protein TsaE